MAAANNVPIPVLPRRSNLSAWSRADEYNGAIWRLEGEQSEQAVRLSSGVWKSIVSANTYGAGRHRFIFTGFHLPSHHTIGVAANNDAAALNPNNTSVGYWANTWGYNGQNGQVVAGGVVSATPYTYTSGAVVVVDLYINDSNTGGTVQYFLLTSSASVFVAQQNITTAPVRLVFSAYDAPARGTFEYVVPSEIINARQDFWDVSPPDWDGDYAVALKRALLAQTKMINIAVVGAKGCGKSSFVNAAATAMSDSMIAVHPSQYGRSDRHITTNTEIHPLLIIHSKYVTDDSDEQDTKADPSVNNNGISLYSGHGVSDAKLDAKNEMYIRQFLGGHCQSNFTMDSANNGKYDKNTPGYLEFPTVNERPHATILLLNGVSLERKASSEYLDRMKPLYDECKSSMNGDDPVIVITFADKIPLDADQNGAVSGKQMPWNPAKVFEWPTGQSIREQIHNRYGVSKANIFLIQNYEGSVPRNKSIDAIVTLALTAACAKGVQRRLKLLNEAAAAKRAADIANKKEMDLTAQIRERLIKEFKLDAPTTTTTGTAGTGKGAAASASTNSGGSGGSGGSGERIGSDEFLNRVELIGLFLLDNKLDVSRITDVALHLAQYEWNYPKARKHPLKPSTGNGTGK